MIHDLRYKNAVIYSLDVDTFMDQNGDGVGDFEGVMRRLDYLHAPGISTIWLTPFQKTPNRDSGYDIADFYNVDPQDGSSGDFVEFTNRANKLRMSVIIDHFPTNVMRQSPTYQPTALAVVGDFSISAKIG